MEHKKKKRIRSDTFWTNSEEDNAEYFGAILDGRHPLYCIDEQADVNLDYKSRKRSCWKLLHKGNGKFVAGLRSTATYRLALVWSIHSNYWNTPERKQRIASALPTVLTKRGDHSRHRCPNPWCCNPGHFQIGTRTDNEVDKHFHYFLKMEGHSTRFMDDFRPLCKKQKVWGYYPPSEEL